MPRATGTLTAAQVAALNATPISVIDAPGSGKYIHVKRVKWFLDFNSAAYDAAAAGDTLGLKYTNGSGDQLVQTTPGDTFGGASADAHRHCEAADEIVPVENAAVVAHIDTGEWYSAAGDSPVKYEIVYTIEELLT